MALESDLVVGQSEVNMLSLVVFFRPMEASGSYHFMFAPTCITWSNSVIMFLEAV